MAAFTETRTTADSGATPTAVPDSTTAVAGTTDAVGTGITATGKYRLTLRKGVARSNGSVLISSTEPLHALS